VRRYIQGLEQAAISVNDLPPLRGVVRDPNDDMVVACAVKGEAQHIVTRDKDLLSLVTYEDIAMVTPERYRHMLREAGHR
jgi:predicted nucleic acid-binding protein